ncbi:SixA phosphatase family protein [Sphingomicrobium nitratireducens]|uniref:SixA phosphatase family protein n=1 Tax=Sphingomicrobium nitratireducens TaxID=2964666 RepID=UPI0022409944|nr:histidine phosphatase family protein [Sphingomicrobium nitratireducens]
MPELLLLRHAKSDWSHAGLPDFDRPLNERGREAAPRVGTLLATLDPVERVVASPARRVVETLRGVRETCPRLPEPHFDQQLYGASIARLMGIVRGMDADVSRLLIAGHNPGMHWLATDLVGDGDGKEWAHLREKYPTAALCEIALPRWSDVGAGSGRLVRFVRPRDL